MPLSDHELDEMLASLRSAPSPGPQLSDDGFQNNVWLRIGELDHRRVSRQKSLLGAIIFLSALGAGFGTSQQPAMAMTQTNLLIGGTDYSPANLLHLSQ